MTAIAKDLYVEQGATFVAYLRWLTADANGDPVERDLTGWTFRMQARKKRGTAVLLEATTENDFIIPGVDPDDRSSTHPTFGGTPDPTNGWLLIEIPAETTDAITASEAAYDLEGVDEKGYVYRLLQGTLNISPNITQAVTP